MELALLACQQFLNDAYSRDTYDKISRSFACYIHKKFLQVFKYFRYIYIEYTWRRIHGEFIHQMYKRLCNIYIYIYVCQSNTCGWKPCLFWCTTNKRHRYTHRITVRACSLQEFSVAAAINKPGYMESSSAYI